MTRRWHRARCGAAQRRRLTGAFLLGDKYRAGEPITPAGHGFDPPASDGRLAEHSQRRDLHGEIALLDGLVRPCRLDLWVFRNHCAGPFDQGPQQSDRPALKRQRLAAAQQQVVLRANWSQHIDRHRGNILTTFGNVFATFSDRIQDIPLGGAQARGPASSQPVIGVAV